MSPPRCGTKNLAPDAIRRAFDASLKKLKLDHVDLYLVHWPAKNMNLPAMFENLAEAEGGGPHPRHRRRQFQHRAAEDRVEEIGAPIACNQIEYHVMLDQTPVRKYLRAKSIPLVAYLPAGAGRAASDATLTRSAASTAPARRRWR